jgi:site-specific recombinase XerC
MIVTASSAAAYVGRVKAVRDPSAHTLKAYTSDLRDYAGFLARRELCPRRSETLVACAEHLRTERAAAPRTLRRRMARLRGFYKDLVRSGAIERSPFVGLEMQLPRPRSLPRTLTRAETRRLADAAWERCEGRKTALEDSAFPAAVLLLISVGLRIGELVQLRAADFDAESGALRVRGKGRRERCVFVVDRRLRVLMAGAGFVRAFDPDLAGLLGGVPGKGAPAAPLAVQAVADRDPRRIALGADDQASAGALRFAYRHRLSLAASRQRKGRPGRTAPCRREGSPL